MRLASIGDFLGAVTFGQHHHRSAVGLEQVHIGVHAPRGGRTERPRSHTFWSLGRSRIVHRVILKVLGQVAFLFQAFAQLGMGDIARHDHRAAQRQSGLDRVLRQFGQDFPHGSIQVNLHRFVGIPVQFRIGGVGQETPRISIQSLDKYPVLVNLRHALAVGGTRHGDRHWQRGPVARQAHHSHIVAEVFAAELGADSHLAGQLQHLFFHLFVAEAVCIGTTGGGQTVQVVRRGILGGLQSVFRRGTPDNNRQVIGRAGRGSQRANLFLQELHHVFGIQNRLSHLVQIRLIRRTPAFRHKEEAIFSFVSRRGLRIQLDLSRQVTPCILFLVHTQGRVLGVPQIQLGIGVIHTQRQRFLVGTFSQNMLPPLAFNNCGAGVLTHRQHPGSGNIGVAQQVHRHEFIVSRCLGVIHNATQLFEVSGAQIVGNIVECGFGQQSQGSGRDLEEFPTLGTLDFFHPLRSQLAIGIGVFAVR